MFPATLTRQANQRSDPGPDPVPGMPAIQVSHIQGQFADCKEHVDLGRPRHRLPAARAVVDSPVVQARVTVGQGVDAGQDRDQTDRVQGCTAGARVHAETLRLRVRILAMASSAVSSASGSVCRYFSVVVMLP